MEISKIQDADIEGKKVLLRIDFNVAVENGRAKETFKIKACQETVKYLLEKKCKIALCSHLGRPEGKPNLEFSLEQIKADVENILGVKINFIGDCAGDKVKNSLEDLNSGEVLLLENVRFYEGEESNDANFAKKLAENFEIFINDAFSVCHRDQASVTGVAKILPSYAGFWLQKEIENLDRLKNNPEKPAVAVIGGAKIETKLPVIQTFEKIYDYVLVGGKIANEAVDQKISFSEKVILPIDYIDDRLDIGPDTISKFSQIIKGVKTIIWNGPMGKFEEEKYAVGTQKIFEAIISGSAYTLVGGGETLEILEKNNAMDKISFVSTGGGAMLEYLSGSTMPGIEVLKK
ncbi:MAG: phosphoglycerate kinase [Candidatus Moranbacteria bacterium]|nr:phosphoglycerate kinase [Candidatus Moranbacteria bacterium]